MHDVRPSVVSCDQIVKILIDERSYIGTVWRLQWLARYSHDMSGPRTEEASDQYRDLDTLPGVDVLSLIAVAQREAIDAVANAVPDLVGAAEAIARRMRAGGRLVYAGAGSSGLLAQVDALELPGTYGIDPRQIVVLLAGGREALFDIPSGAEDDGDAAAREVVALGLTTADCLVAISASGSTPYVVSALRQARNAGAMTVGIASNPGTALLEHADHPVLLATPPEVIAGSTRMNAGTAQKCALNMLSTLVAIRLGHAFRGLMVNMKADNEKLRRRAVAVVIGAAGVSEATAREALERSHGSVKPAILLAAGARSLEEAEAFLKSRGGDVRDALASLAADDSKADPTAVTNHRRTS